MATPEEIEKLKQNWLEDPCWDIETTEGFKEHFEELLAWRLEHDNKLAAEKRLRTSRLIKELGVDAETAKSLHTFAEIKYQAEAGEVACLERGDFETQVIFFKMQTQIHATLLLAAQVKRVADILQAMAEEQEQDNNLNFMTKLYKQE